MTTIRRNKMTTRKHAFYGILALVSLLGLGITQSARGCADNLVTNGGFETGDFTGWTLTGNTGFTGVSGTFIGVPPHGGSYQAFLGPIGSDGFLTQNVATTAGGSYVIDFWLYNFGGTPSDFDVQWDGATIYSVTNPGAFPYTEYTFYVTASTATTALEFSFRQDPSYFLLDDICVTSVPDAGSTLPLLGFALAGLGILRRKLRC
jgi:VPDSG-CTERM motif